MSTKVPIHLSAQMRYGNGADRDLTLDLADLAWNVHGQEYVKTPPLVMLDLIEIARTIHEFDKRQPKRTTSVRVERVEVDMPVREADRWNRPSVRTALTELLRIQANVDWNFTFRQRRSQKTSADTVFGQASSNKLDTKSAILFSGGIDSTSGLATIKGDRNAHLLVAYYSGNLTKQREIASMLGFERLIQVTGHWGHFGSSARSGGMFWYRSFLFLAIAAAFAAADNAPKIIQFENGVLALSVGALPIYRVTRHAHPAVHRAMMKLIQGLTGRAIEISNPFLKLTKAEVVCQLRNAVSEKDFQRIVELSETCWYLKSTAIVAGGKKKDPGQPCGACVPCLIRRSALLTGEEVETGVDFTRQNSNLAKDPVVRVHFDAYTAFAQRLLRRDYTQYQFIEDCPDVTQDVVRNGSVISEGEAFALYRRFAQDWKKAFF